MGRRALRTGDLVCVKDKKFVSDPGLGLFLTPDYTWVTEGSFIFGLYLGGSLIVNEQGKRTSSWAYVLDSQTMKFGWVVRSYLKRIE